MAVGDIGAVIASLKFETGIAKYCKIAHAQGEIYAVFYLVSATVGRVSTVQITTLGAITGEAKDTYDVVLGRDTTLDIVKVADGVVAIAYSGVSTHGFVRTLEINAAGAIDDTPLDTLEYDALWSTKSRIVHVTDDIYAISYANASGYGQLTTVDISAAGEINDTITSYLVFTDYAIWVTNLVRISSTLVAVITRDSSNNGRIHTFAINAVGAITDPAKDSQIFGVLGGEHGNGVALNRKNVALAYQGSDGVGLLKTYVISDTGEITDTRADEQEYDDRDTLQHSITHVSQEVYAIAYPIYLITINIGILKTYTISDLGIITDTKIDELTFEDDMCGDPHIIHISSNAYAIVYSGPDSEGWLKTVNVETMAPGQVKDLMLMGIG